MLYFHPGQSHIYDRLIGLRACVNTLPPVNRELLKYLLEFLAMVCQYSEDNKMTTSNVAIIFGPNLMQPKEMDPVSLIEDAAHVNGITKTMIDEVDFIMNVSFPLLLESARSV